MKQLLLLPLLLFTSCAAHRSKLATTPAAPTGRPVNSNGLRTEDELKEYRLGRYMDARDPLVMHEGHPVYRVETTARWDLRRNSGAPLPPGNLVQPKAVSANDAVIAEVNKQRAATRAFTDQTAALNQKLTELSHAVRQTEEIAKQNLSLKKDVADLREHLDALDAQLNQPKPTPSPQPSPEDRW